MSKISLQPNASGTGTFTLEAPNSNTNRTLTLPDEAGNVLTDVSDIESQVKTATNATGSAPVYACRAWVNFDGTGTVSIRASGNVSSITDNGTGDYTVNLTTAMTDTSYSVFCSGNSTVTGLSYLTFRGIGQSVTTSSFGVSASNGANSFVDLDRGFVSVFR